MTAYIRHWQLLAIGLATWLGLIPAAWAEPPAPAPAADAAASKAEDPKFIRVRRDDDNRPATMETAVISYTSKTRPGVTIDLIGAVHIGDRSYYDELNKQFEKYDVVLYELVAKEGTRIPKEGRTEKSSHPIGMMQDGMSTILELSHQLACIDYTKENLRARRHVPRGIQQVDGTARRELLSDVSCG